MRQSAPVSLTHRLREQARSHNLTECSRQHCTALPLLFCGSWLACDAGTSVYQAQPADAIAGKPAPTFDRVQTTPIYLINRNPNVGAGLLAKAVGQLAHVSLTHRLREQARSHNLTEYRPPAPHCLCFSVGAGLPAMQAPRSIRHNQLMPSQASQLPHLIELIFKNQVGCQAASPSLLI